MFILFTFILKLNNTKPESGDTKFPLQGSTREDRLSRQAQKTYLMVHWANFSSYLYLGRASERADEHKKQKKLFIVISSPVANCIYVISIAGSMNVMVGNGVPPVAIRGFMSISG